MSWIQAAHRCCFDHLPSLRPQDSSLLTSPPSPTFLARRKGHTWSYPAWPPSPLDTPIHDLPYRILPLTIKTVVTNHKLTHISKPQVLKRLLIITILTMSCLKSPRHPQMMRLLALDCEKNQRVSYTPNRFFRALHSPIDEKKAKGMQREKSKKKRKRTYDSRFQDPPL